MAINKRSVNSSTVRWVLVAGIIFLFTAGFIWYKRIYLNPQNVFWGMIENNLSTNSITRQTKTGTEDQGSTQYTRLQANSQKASEVLEVTKQNNTLVMRQTIGTVEADFARYFKINSDRKNANGQPVDYSSVEGVWGKAETEGGGQTPSQAFNQALLGTIPAANLAFQQRQELMKTLRDSNVFNVDFSKVSKDGGLYAYNVQINAKPYFSMMKQFVGFLGLDTSIVPDPENYEDVSPLELKVSIKPTARQLVKINYITNGQEEIYSGYGLNGPIEIPKDSISLKELQERIRKLQ